jgi:RHS repeat-associated protein
VDVQLHFTEGHAHAGQPAALRGAAFREAEHRLRRSRQDDGGRLWTTRYVYDTPDGVYGPPGHVTNEVGGQSAFTYDSLSGLLTSSTSPVNTIVGAGPDFAGSTTQITGYEEHGLPTQVVDPLLRAASTTYQAPYNGSGSLNVTTTFAADGKARQVQLDPMDRVVDEWDERGVITDIGHNPQNQITSVTRNSGGNPALGRYTSYHYDDRGDMVLMNPPSGIINNNWQIPMDYRQYRTDGALETKSGAYPNGIYLARLGRIAYPDGNAECFGYNAAGEMIWKRKRDGSVISFTRDVQHRIKTAVYPATLGGLGVTVTRLYDEFGRPKQVSDATGTTFLVWDALNRPAHAVYPSPQKSIDFSYQGDTTYHRWTTTLNVSGLGVYQFSEDSKGRQYQVTNPFSQVSQTEYSLDGTLRKRTWPNGVTEQRGYNPRGFLSQILIQQPGGATLNEFDYKYGYDDNNPNDYDGTGHIRREVDHPQGGPVQTHAFFYDDLYELIGESDPALGTGSLTYPYDVNYTYDLNGNRTSRVQGSATDYYGVDAADRLLWVNRGTNGAPTSGQANPYTLLTYDANGFPTTRDRRDNNLVQQKLWLWWDSDDRLRKATTTADPNGAAFWQAGYNADGIRTTKDELRTGLLTHHDFSWIPMGLLWDSNASTTYTPGFSQRAGGTDSFFQTDWLGSTRYVTASNGTTVTAAQSYDAFGHRDAQAMGSPNHPTDMQWAGGWGYQTEWSNGASEPGLGLEYLQQRYYDPLVGRFISPDPIGFAGGLNLYGYAGDDPVGLADPFGLAATPGDQLPVGVKEGIWYRPVRRGSPPRDADNVPIELHHRGQCPEGPLDEMRLDPHRGKGNHGRNHPNRESDVDHGPAWEKEKRDYWKDQFDNGRFENLPLPPGAKRWEADEPRVREDWTGYKLLIGLITLLYPSPLGSPAPAPQVPLRVPALAH